MKDIAAALAAGLAALGASIGNGLVILRQLRVWLVNQNYLTN
jgi:hypothetical protein